MNAANEVAVSSYLEEKISFVSIPRVIEQAMNAHTTVAVNTVDEIRAVDAWARVYSHKLARELELKV